MLAALRGDAAGVQAALEAAEEQALGRSLGTGEQKAAARVGKALAQVVKASGASRG